MMTAPLVTVCVPVFDETAAIARTIESVLSSGYPADKLEIIAVVDGGRPEVCDAAAHAGARVIPLVPNQGSYAARNAAIDAASRGTAAFLFTDADCVVRPGWVQAHLDALEEAELSGGQIVFTFRSATPTPAEWIDSLRHLKQQHYVERTGFAVTANLAVRREIFETFKFDGRMRTGGDAEFCLRATAAGARLVYTPAAVIEHAARPSTAALLSKARRIASGAARIEASLARTPPTASVRPSGAPFRLAREAGYPVGLWWGLRAAMIDYRVQTIRRGGRSKPSRD
jgi:GT2 family glycosyltransferase